MGTENPKPQEAADSFEKTAKELDDLLGSRLASEKDGALSPERSAEFDALQKKIQSSPVPADTSLSPEKEVELDDLAERIENSGDFL